jgi:hypothetical protein
LFSNLFILIPRVFDKFNQSSNSYAEPLLEKEYQMSKDIPLGRSSSITFLIVINDNSIRSLVQTATITLIPEVPVQRFTISKNRRRMI